MQSAEPEAEGFPRITALFQLMAGAFLGLVAFLTTVPASVIRGGAESILVHPDHPMYIASLRYFIWDQWRWPLMLTAGYGSERGSVVVFNDILPIYALLLKLFRGAITVDFNFFAVSLAVSFACQGIAAVAAVRMWGVRRWMPAIAAALFSLSMAAWILRAVHIATVFHAPLLLACGLIGMAGHRRRNLVVAAAIGLSWFTLMVNVYLFVMVAVLVTAVFALMFRNGWPLRRAAVAGAILVSGCVLIMTALGYFAPHGIGQGFSFFSMNVLSPILPLPGTLLGSTGSAIDATGGQYEGFNYLGVGLIVAIVIASAMRWRDLPRIARSYRPLLWTAIGLTLFSLSNQIFLGSHLFALLPPPPDVIAQFRTPGRFFWPVSYLLVVACTVALSRKGRRGELILLAAALLQWTDAAGVRGGMRALYSHAGAAPLARARWDDLARSHRKFELRPDYECASAGQRAILNEIILIASIPRTEVTTLYSGRPLPTECAKPASAKPVELGAGTLFVAVEGEPLPPEATQWKCEDLGAATICDRRE